MPTPVSRKVCQLPAHQRGLTLVELVIAIVVLSVALYSSLQAFAFFSGRNADALLQTRALDLAQLYLDEILAKSFDEDSGPGGIPPYIGCRITDDGESRALFDDVDDYHALDEAPALADQDLSALYAGYRVTVSVSCDATVGVNSGGAKRIELQVTSPQGDSSRFAVYRGNF